MRPPWRSSPKRDDSCARNIRAREGSRPCDLSPTRHSSTTKAQWVGWRARPNLRAMFSELTRSLGRWRRAAALISCLAAPLSSQTASRVIMNDSHFHLTNYVQQGPPLREFVKLLGDSVGRVALFG